MFFCLTYAIDERSVSEIQPSVSTEYKEVEENEINDVSQSFTLLISQLPTDAIWKPCFVKLLSVEM